MAACTCARIGYAIFLCQEHAPIPYEITQRGRRAVGNMKQWDAIEPTLIQVVGEQRAIINAARRAGRRIEARTARAGKNA